MYCYNYLFLQILIFSFCISIHQLKKCASFCHNGRGDYRVKQRNSTQFQRKNFRIQIFTLEKKQVFRKFWGYRKHLNTLFSFFINKWNYTCFRKNTLIGTLSVQLKFYNNIDAKISFQKIGILPRKRKMVSSQHVVKYILFSLKLSVSQISFTEQGLS